MKKIIPILLWVFAVNTAGGQNTIGIPDIINHSKNKYEAGASSWDITQDQNGIMYFANSEGLLSYDGHYWNIHAVPNKTMLRSVVAGKDGRIYAGSQDDFGYFSPGTNARLEFHSLSSLIPAKNRFFTGVWDIILTEDEVFFKSTEKIFQYDQRTLKIYAAAGEWRFLGKHQGRLVAQDSKNGLLRFENGTWIPFLKNPILPADFTITSISHLSQDSSLVTTLKNGLFILSGDELAAFTVQGNHPLMQERMLSSIPVNNDCIAVGTQTNGCFILDKNGQIIGTFSRKEGLQNNNILSLFLDRDQNLWLGLDNGIDFIAYNNSVKHIYPDQLNEGIGYSSMVYNGLLYIGTSTGLYSVPTNDVKDLSTIREKFTPVPGMRAPAWGLFKMNSHLLLAHHEGAYLIAGDRVEPVNNQTGYFNFQPFHPVLPSSVVIGGNYNGLDFIEYKNGNFVSAGNIKGFREGSRFIAVDNNGAIWISHPYKGIYRLELEKENAKTKLYTQREGLPSVVKNHLFKIKNQIVFTTEKGIYEYNEAEDRIRPSAWFQTLFGNKNIRYLKEDAVGNIWFFENKNLGVADFSGGEPRIIYFPELNGKIVSDFEHIYPFDAGNVFIGADKGFYHINYDLYKKNRKELSVHIRSVNISGEKDSLLFGGFSSPAAINSSGHANSSGISYRNNSLHFSYSSPAYNQQSNVEYSYKLDGFDKDWSAWSKKTEKDYTNLPPGAYTFRVKAKSNLGNESVATTYSFEILHPWYATPIARILYVVLAAGIILLMYKRLRIIYKNQELKHEEEQKKLQYLHQLEMDKNEKEIVKLKNEKLQAEIEFKNSELASVAMHLVQKGELLSKIKDELVHLRKEMNGETSSGDFKKIINTIREEDRMDKDWEQFTIHFDKIQGDFLKSLKQAWPTLSPHELKLCAYLVMNLSSKEIAQLMKISVRGVEISRYRLRKKLQIPTETNLFNFLLEFSTSGQKLRQEETQKT